jgi:hypothetical protein
MVQRKFEQKIKLSFRAGGKEKNQKSGDRRQKKLDWISAFVGMTKTVQPGNSAGGVGSSKF